MGEQIAVIRRNCWKCRRKIRKMKSPLNTNCNEVGFHFYRIIILRRIHRMEMTIIFLSHYVFITPFVFVSLSVSEKFHFVAVFSDSLDPGQQLKCID